MLPALRFVPFTCRPRLEMGSYLGPGDRNGALLNRSATLEERRGLVSDGIVATVQWSERMRTKQGQHVDKRSATRERSSRRSARSQTPPPTSECVSKLTCKNRLSAACKMHPTDRLVSEGRVAMSSEVAPALAVHDRGHGVRLGVRGLQVAWERVSFTT